MDPLTRVNQLMSLALNNSFSEEARSSAVAAIRLIHDHGLVVTDPKAAPVYPRSPFQGSSRPAPARRDGVEAGDYTLEVQSAQYAGTGRQRHLFRVDFVIREAFVIQEMVGSSIADEFDFQTPLSARTRQFVHASGFDFPDAVIPTLSLTRWAQLIPGTRYHASVGPMWRGGPVKITRIEAYRDSED